MLSQQNARSQLLRTRRRCDAIKPSTSWAVHDPIAPSLVLPAHLQNIALMRTTVISAPGKVLVAGGYLVLDPAYSGVVVSTSSRFYTAIRDEPALPPNTLRVRSPQFLNANWSYTANLEPSVVIEPVAAKSVYFNRMTCILVIRADIGSDNSQPSKKQIRPPCITAYHCFGCRNKGFSCRTGNVFSAA